MRQSLMSSCWARGARVKRKVHNDSKMRDRTYVIDVEEKVRDDTTLIYLGRMHSCPSRH